ncbi:SUMF1/EgtB/PvdO family nonheme iron enzyme [Candidatus Thiodictyon syntrophicum]|uniref:SUMF1/EgtB/PvdO family nonheme iron enzyme n=1 Tax=Candidatus Thiodictyon syntrophicum TaxID=1166950 RepID=UPI003AAF97E1
MRTAMYLNWQNSPRRSNVQRFRHCRRAARPVADHPAGTRWRRAKVCARRTSVPDPALAEIVTGPRPAPGNKPGKEWIETVTGMAFLWVPPGRFLMGLEHSQDKIYRVNLTRGFWLGKHPVTEQQWRRLMPGRLGKGDPKTRHYGYPSSFDDYPINYLGW